MKNVKKTIVDMNGHELKPGDPIIFTLQSDLHKGTIVRFAGQTAHIYSWSKKRITKLKTDRYLDRKSDVFITHRLMSLFGVCEKCANREQEDHSEINSEET